MKRIVLIGIAVCLCLGCASTGKNYSGSWNFDYWIRGSGENQTVTIMKYEGTSTEVNIPPVIRGYPVTVISSWAFNGKKLTKVTIPSSVTTIEVRAFSDNQLTSITIPEGVTSIELSAFMNNKLTSVTIPSSVTSLAGFDNNQLTSVTIPSSVTTIEVRAFADNQLTSVTIPSSVTTIYLGAFSNNQLTSVNIGNGVTIIDSDAFRNNQLTSVIIPDSVTAIGRNTFANNQLTSVIIGNSVTRIYNNAFANNQLTSVSIPSSVTIIDENAFADNPLTSVTIPSSVRTIGQRAFGDTIHSLLTFYGKRSGTYELRNNQWYYNGTALVSPAELRLGRNAWLVSIDGKSPESFISSDLTKETPASITANINKNLLRNEYFIWPSNFPSRITEFFQGSFYLPPGTHTIEVIYLAPSRSGVSYTTDSMIWEQRYLFEGYTYQLTAEPTADGKQIQFGIRRL